MAPAEQREEDAAFFEDWSFGSDAAGLWLWPVIEWRAIVVRDHGSGRMIELIRSVGGVLQRHGRYDIRQSGDWIVPALRWRQLKALIPLMQAARLERQTYEANRKRGDAEVLARQARSIWSRHLS